MKKVTVSELKEKLQEYIDILEQYDDELEVPTVSNTYFIHSSEFMQMGSAGFIDLGNLDENLQESQEEAENDDEEEEDEDA